MNNTKNTKIQETKTKQLKQLELTLEKLYIKQTDFFIKPETKIDIDPKISDITLECQGYALFYPEEVLKNFILFLINLSNKVQNQNLVIKYFKIQLYGFNVHKKDFATIQQCIIKISNNLKVLIIHTSDISGVLFDDFLMMFQIFPKLSENNINFEQFSLQCANWNFVKFEQNYKQFSQKLQSKIPSQNTVSQLFIKRVRIQISGWFAEQQQARYFVKQKEAKEQQNLNSQVSCFHLGMVELISRLMELLPNIQLFQLDMRNNHECLKMKQMRNKLLTQVVLKNRQERQISVMQKSISRTVQAEDNLKQYRFNVVV